MDKSNFSKVSFFQIQKSGLKHDFGSRMRCSFPEYRERLTEWKAKDEDCLQDLCSEALFQKCSFLRNAGKCAEWD